MPSKVVISPLFILIITYLCSIFLIICYQFAVFHGFSLLFSNSRPSVCDPIIPPSSPFVLTETKDLNAPVAVKPGDFDAALFGKTFLFLVEQLHIAAVPLVFHKLCDIAFFAERFRRVLINRKLMKQFHLSAPFVFHRSRFVRSGICIALFFFPGGTHDQLPMQTSICRDKAYTQYYIISPYFLQSQRDE